MHSSTTTTTEEIIATSGITNSGAFVEAAVSSSPPPPPQMQHISFGRKSFVVKSGLLQASRIGINSPEESFAPIALK